MLLTHSPTNAAVQLFLVVGFFGLWYWILLRGWAHARQPAEHLIIAPFLIFPALFVPMSLRLLQAVRGLTYSFDASTRSIKRNSERIASFEEAESLQVRTIHSKRNEYRLTLVLRGDKKLRLAQMVDEQAVMRVANQIADVLAVPVHRTSLLSKLGLG